ncbi:reverse transcriptase domain-containing protein [Tanacetum coccineum]
MSIISFPPPHPIIILSDFNVHDTFSSTHSPDYIPASPDYFPASPGNTSSNFLDDLTKDLLASLALSPFYDDPYMKVVQAYDPNDNELPIPPPALIAPPTILPPSLVLSLSPMGGVWEDDTNGPPSLSSKLELWHDLGGKLPVELTGSCLSVSRSVDLEASIDDVQAVAVELDITAEGPVLEYACKLMCDAKQGGSVINIASAAGIDRGETPGGLAYTCSKSEITKGILEEEWVKNVAKKVTPMRTFGTGDLALTKFARYLIHDSSKYIRVNVFIIDAGTSLSGVPIFSSLLIMDALELKNLPHS